ncbi:hypothetical protein TUSST3_15250 [Streptomyces sp. TUS-ST3]|nr:hypothetical protein TUSST3_15250 [Streptomyces sp. TUS-ST3]
MPAGGPSSACLVVRSPSSARQVISDGHTGVGAGRARCGPDQRETGGYAATSLTPGADVTRRRSRCAAHGGVVPQGARGLVRPQERGEDADRVVVVDAAFVAFA